MTKTALLRNGPIIAFLCVLFLLWPAKAILRQAEHVAGFRFDKPLVGQFRQEKRPEDLLGGLWSHEFQRWAEHDVGESIPLKGWIVRSTNQIFYDLFSKSYMGGDNPLIIGHDKNVFSASYLFQYCNTKKNAPDQTYFNAWADRLDRTRHWLETQGKTFIYFVSPSKAAYYPEDIPQGFGCDDGSNRPRYIRALAAIAGKGIPTVDAAALMLAEKGKHSVEMFPIGGIHYNSLGAAMTTNALTAALNAARGTALPQISIAYEKKPDARNAVTERDVTELLNLVRPYVDYPVPELAWGGYPLANPLPLKVTFVGGSFVAQPARLMSLYRLFQSVDHFSYFRLAKVHYPDENASGIAGPADYDSLFASDVVILEENEETAMSLHGLAFLDEAERRQASQGGD